MGWVCLRYWAHPGSRLHMPWDLWPDNQRIEAVKLLIDIV
jgi:hypothetical protein